MPQRYGFSICAISLLLSSRLSCLRLSERRLSLDLKGWMIYIRYDLRNDSTGRYLIIYMVGTPFFSCEVALINLK